MPFRRGLPKPEPDGDRPPDAAVPAAPPEPASDGSGSSASPAFSPEGGVLTRRPGLALTLLGIGALAIAAGAYAVAVLLAAGQRVENLALLGAELRSEAERAASLARLEPIGIASFAIALAVIAFTGYMRQRVTAGLAVALMAGIAVVIAELLKEVVPRPELVAGARWILRNSFPSGTATVAMAVAVGALLVAPDRVRWLTLIAGSALVALVAHALQVTGWHRLSDVIGGGALAVAVMAFGTAVLAANGWTAPSTAAGVHPGVHRVLLVAAAGVIGLGMVLVVVLALFPILGRPDGGDRAILQVAFPLIGAGACVALLSAFARIIGPWTLRGPRPSSGLPRAVPDVR